VSGGAKWLRGHQLRAPAAGIPAFNADHTYLIKQSTSDHVTPGRGELGRGMLYAWSSNQCFVCFRLPRPVSSTNNKHLGQPSNRFACVGGRLTLTPRLQCVRIPPPRPSTRPSMEQTNKIKSYLGLSNTPKQYKMNKLW
jgi:hypothetical protein